MSDRIQIKSIGGLIAAIPSLLHFVPRQSIVLVFLSGGRLSFVTRAGFRADGSPRAIESLIEKNDIDAVTVIVVAKNRTFIEVLDESDRMDAMLRGCGVTVQDIIYTPSIDGGETWTDMRSFETGTVDDPATTETAAATVLLGKSVAKSRDEMSDRYRHGQGSTDTDRSEARTVREELGDGFPRHVIGELADAVSTRTEPSGALAARVGLLITTNLMARDAILGLAVIDPAVAAETMAVVAHKLGGPERVAALTVAGFLAYVNFQGPDAGCVFESARAEAALHPESDTRLLGLVEKALRAGLPPRKMRSLSGTGVAIARREFGIELPAPGEDWL